MEEENKASKLWCLWQAQKIDEPGQPIVCLAHLVEDRVLYCPYQDLDQLPKSKYPCLDYKERSRK